MTEPTPAFSRPSRQSPVAVVFLAWRVLRQISLVNIAILVVAISSGRLPVSGLALITIVLLGLAAAGVLSWWNFVFVVEDGELRVDKGVLAREHLAIPLNRVQTVSLQQGLLHQILGLTRVSVDTAGSSVVEFTFDALDRHRAEMLQQMVARHRASVAREPGAGSTLDAPPPEGPPLYRVDPDVAAAPPPEGAPSATVPPPGVTVPGLGSAPPPMSVDRPEVIAVRSFVDLVKVGLGSWPWAGLVVIFPLLAVADELQGLAGVDVFDDLTAWLEGVEGNGVSWTVSTSVLIVSVLGFLLLATAVGWLFQIGRSVLTNWELTLSRTRTDSGDSLRRDAGLMNRTTVSANLARVQNVHASQNLIQRLLGINNVTLHITGETDIQIPGSSNDELQRVLALAIPSGEPDLDRRVAGAHVYREFRTGAVIGLLVGVVTAVTIGWWGLFALLIPLQALIAGIMYWKSMRWGFTEERIGYRYGIVNGQTHHLELVKTQSVTVRQSWFERRRGLATFRIRSAESEFAVPMIVKEEAEALRDFVLAQVESSSRSWM